MRDRQRQRTRQRSSPSADLDALHALPSEADHSGVSDVLPAGAIFKDTVVVGNGPSGIALSHLLAGNWPYLQHDSHPDELLGARLSGLKGQCLLHQDLRFLCQGLEGRSNHPVSLLMDALSHPGADMGLEIPGLLQWRHHPEQLVDHVVLGKGPPGGAWQAMDGNVLTISLAAWMELPGLEFRTWEKMVGTGKDIEDANNNQPTNTNGKAGRALVASVAQYYADYVRLKGLERFFRCGTTVTSIEPLKNASCQCTGKIMRRCCGREQCFSRALWRVDGIDTVTGESFCYGSRRVVLATGGTDCPNRLNVPGESAQHGLVVHDLRLLEKALDSLRKDAGLDQNGITNVDPVLIVGAGLSAADAVIAARFHSIPVLHIFRNRTIPIDRQLPEIMYPEYHKVHQMMGDSGEGYSLYHALPQYSVVSLSGLNSPSRKVILKAPDGGLSIHRVSLAAVLIGARPDFSFLQSVCGKDGLGLGVDERAPVDCRSNPLLVDPWTHEVSKSPQPGLYALGPITGDNFVRFIVGGTISIAASIHQNDKVNAAVLY